jgi:hypothetical protein
MKRATLKKAHIARSILVENNMSWDTSRLRMQIATIFHFLDVVIKYLQVMKSMFL